MDGQREFTITWVIEHFSYLWSEGIYSPWILISDFEYTQWRLKIILRKPNGFLSCFLCRHEDDEGPTSVAVGFEFCLVTSHGNEANSGRTTECYQFPSVRDGSNRFSWGFPGLIERLEKINKTVFLPSDVLTIKCRMWMGEGDAMKVGNCRMRSQVGLEKTSTSWKIDNFSSLKPGVKKCLTIKTIDSKIILNLFLKYHLSGEEKIHIDVLIPAEEKFTKVTSCSIYLLDTSGNRVECVSDVVGNENIREIASDIQIWSLIFLQSRQDIFEKENVYLPNDTLSLHCEFGRSNGKFISNDVLEIHKSVMGFEEESDSVNKIALHENNTFKMDMWSMFEEGAFTDVELKTETKTFRAHSLVLCARSSVFRAMFTTEMKEKQEKCVLIDDMDDDTVYQLLQFLYKDSVEGLQWENAVNLYKAADKYQIAPLRKFCYIFLKDNFSIKNICHALVLAELHSDKKLKNATQNFVDSNYKGVLKSDEWKALEKDKPQLVIEIYRNIFQNR